MTSEVNLPTMMSQTESLRLNRPRDIIFWTVVRLVPREMKQSRVISGQNLWCHGEVHGLFWSRDRGMVSVRKMIQYELDDRR